ncbi:MAG: hypothetical protein HOK95_06100 [Candidatus Marinimicrobia bacterium]|jgi:hypothetical protein|nr:hypothetical protein [Candidatus Neomarinimicrobiota bacterium]
MKSRSELLSYLARYYYDPAGDTASFLKDISRIKFVNKYLKEYNKTGNFKDRPCINIIIILNNLFGPIPTNVVLFNIVSPGVHKELNSVLHFLNLGQPELKGCNIELLEKLKREI